MEKYVVEDFIMGETLEYFDGPKMFILIKDNKKSLSDFFGNELSESAKSDLDYVAECAAIELANKIYSKETVIPEHKQSQDKFIAYWIGAKKDRDEFLVIPTLDELIEKYKNNEIDLNTFLNINQECMLYSVIYGDKDKIEPISKERVNKLKMPNKGIYHKK